MIGNDEVDAGLAGGFGGGEGANAHIDADDQMHAIGGGTLDYVFAHVVAFADAVRHVETSGAARKFDRSLQDYDRGRTIDVIVAIDQHLFLALNGCFQAIEGRFHPGHCERIVQMVERRREKAGGKRRFFNSTPQEQIGQHGQRGMRNF